MFGEVWIRISFGIVYGGLPVAQRGKDSRKVAVSELVHSVLSIESIQGVRYIGSRDNLIAIVRLLSAGKNHFLYLHVIGIIVLPLDADNVPLLCR